jgi:hypothetical protein
MGDLTLLSWHQDTRGGVILLEPACARGGDPSGAGERQGF